MRASDEKDHQQKSGRGGVDVPPPVVTIGSTMMSSGEAVVASAAAAGAAPIDAAARLDAQVAPNY